MGKRRKPKPNAPPPAKENEAKFDSRLATIMLAKGLVTSTEESLSLAEAIVAEIGESELSREQACIASFEDYFSLSRREATLVLSSLLDLEAKEDKSDDDSASSEEESLNEEEEPDSDDDDGEFIGEGECELCERFIKLTKHHLIPRSTWPRILPRCINASDALSKNDVHRAGLILGPGLHHLLEPLTRAESNKVAIKSLLQITTNICRQCHSHVHRRHDNMELALNFSTVEQLLKDENIFKFCKWASKQRPGKYKL